VDRGGTCAVAGLHLSDIPPLVSADELFQVFFARFVALLREPCVRARDSRVTNIRISEADRAEVHQRIAALRKTVRAVAPPDQRDAAAELVDELQDAIVAEAPNVSRMAFIRDWFSAHVPKLAGPVSELILSPVVRRIVAAAGDLAAAEFRNMLGP
jgi:hypothetical protein